MKALREMDGQGTDENAAAPTIGARGAVQSSEPPPGTPAFEEADQQVREPDKPNWNDLSFFQQLGVSFQRLDEEIKERGASFGADSAARRVQQVQEFQRRQDAGEPLTLVPKQYLLRNRRAASDLGTAVSRLVEARRNLERLPASDALRQFLEAQTAPQAARLLRERPGEIAKALGIESLPGLTLSLITSAVLGPVGGGLVLAGHSGLEGYSNGLIGALADEDVDVTDPEDLAAALQDKDLMDRVRAKATTEGAIQAGVAITSMLGGGGRGKRPLKLKPAEGGHHWVPKAVWDLPNLSPEARRVFNNYTSGRYGEPHYFDGPHREYNQGVQELWDKNKYNPAKMTEKDAWDFIDQVMRSRDPRIKTFRDMILDKRVKYERSSGARPRGGNRR
jgi:hypothetical protein